jgi:hypothetical protein
MVSTVVLTNADECTTVHKAKIRQKDMTQAKKHAKNADILYKCHVTP